MQNEAQAEAAASCNSHGRPLACTGTLQQVGGSSEAFAAMPTQQTATAASLIAAPKAAAQPQQQQQPLTPAGLASALSVDHAPGPDGLLATVHTNPMDVDLRRARNRIIWGSRSSRVITQSAQNSAEPVPQELVSEPSSSSDSGSVGAHRDHHIQQANSSGDLLQLMRPAGAGLPGPAAARPLQQSHQDVQATPVQKRTSLISAAVADSRATATAAMGQRNVQQHSDVLIRLGQVLLDLRRQSQQKDTGSNGAWDKRDMLQTSRLLPSAAAAAPIVGGSSKRPLPQGSLDTQPAKVVKAKQLSGPGNVTAGTSSVVLPTLVATAPPAAGLPLAAVKPDGGIYSSNVPATSLQGLRPSIGTAAGTFSSSLQQRTMMQAAQATRPGAAKHMPAQLPVLQLPLAMRVSYLRAAGFLPSDNSKGKRKVDRASDDAASKPTLPRKRGRRKFSGDEPVVGWDERIYTQGSDRQRVWEEHKMVLRVLDVVLASEPKVAARIKQASVEYNARSCVSCWRARPVSGSWFCSRPVCWDKHKQEYEGEAATAAAVTAFDEVHWDEVKKVVQPVLEERQKQDELQQENSSTAAVVKAGTGADLAGTVGDDAAAGAVAAAAKVAASSSSSGNADAIAGELAITANNPAAAAAPAVTSAQTAPLAAAADGAVISGSGMVSSAAQQEQSEVQQGSAKDAFLVLNQAQQLIDKLEAGKCKQVTLADIDKLQDMKEQVKMEVGSYNPQMMRLTHFIRKARRYFHGSSNSRAQEATEQAHSAQGIDHPASAGDSPPPRCATAAVDSSSSRGQLNMLPGSAAAGDGTGQDSNCSELASADVSAKKPTIGVTEALPSQAPGVFDAAPAAAVGQSEPTTTQQNVTSAEAALATAAVAAASDVTFAGDKAAADPAWGSGEVLANFTLPTREYKYPDLKRLWEEHQLNLRVLLIELKDNPTALAQAQDAINKVFYRPCLRCMSHGGHKCGNGCWFCSNCQRMWGKFNPITEPQAWRAITTGVGVDPRFIARRRNPQSVPVASITLPVKGGHSQQPAEPVLSVPAPAAADIAASPAGLDSIVAT